MFKVKVTFPYPTWDLLRQSPHSSGIWGDYKFYINENIEECDYWVVFNYLLEKEDSVYCSPKNTIFLTGEASSIQSYDEGFMDQFQHVITCQRRIKHKNVTYLHQGHPWHVGRKQSSHKDEAFSKSHSELIAMSPIKKTKKISIIASDLQLTEGHIQRYQFAHALKNYFKDDLVWFGRGINEVSDKWDALAEYRYSVAIENFQEPDWITEKIYDCFLAYAIPFYHGSPNIDEYFSSDSMVKIDINNVDMSIRTIEEVLQDEQYYETHLDALLQSRTRYLNEFNFFPLIVNFIKSKNILPGNSKKYVTIKNIVDRVSTPRLYQKLSSLKRRLGI